MELFASPRRLFNERTPVVPNARLDEAQAESIRLGARIGFQPVFTY